MDLYQIAMLTLAVAGVLTGITATVLTLIFRSSAARERRRQQTLQAYRLLQQESLDILYTRYSMDIMQKIVDDAQDRQQWDEYKKARMLVNRVECFCAGLDRGAYDRKTFFRAAHGFFDGPIRRTLQPMIQREERRGNCQSIRHVWRWMDARGH